MLICHINLSKEFRGGERQTLALINALSAELDQRVVVRRNAPLHTALASSGTGSIEIAAVPNSPLAALAATADADLVHVHEGRSVLIGALRSLRGTPFIATRRVTKPPSDRATTRWSYSRSRCIIAVSHAVAGVMKAYDPRLAVRTIHDCAPALRSPSPDCIAALRNRYPGKILIGQVGQLEDAMKGQQLTLAAARHLRRSRPDLQFLLIGDGPDEARLKLEAEGLQNVQFTGWIPNVEDYYAALDVFVFPSRSEGLGSSILEAMSFGVPVVAAAVGGIPELIEPGKNGFLFDAGDVDALTRQLMKIADDTALLKKLGSGARSTAVAMSPERSAEQHQKLYETVLEAPVASSR